jgi:hypothetical protein
MVGFCVRQNKKTSDFKFYQLKRELAVETVERNLNVFSCGNRKESTGA